MRGGMGERREGEGRMDDHTYPFQLTVFSRALIPFLHPHVSSA